MKEKDLKQLINIACHDAAKYHLIKPIVDRIQDGQKFRYWLLVLDQTIAEQKQTFLSIRGGLVGIITDYAYIVHNHDMKENGDIVREHVHMFVYTSKGYSYLSFLKQTGLTPITCIPTVESNKLGWLDYVTNHTEGKHVYDDSEVVFSTDQFKSTFYKEGKGMRGMLMKDKIELVEKTLQPLFQEYQGKYLKQSVVNKKLAEDPVTADVYNYPLLYRQFVEIPLQEHNQSMMIQRPQYDYDLFFDDLRKGKIPNEVVMVMKELFDNGEIPVESVTMAAMSGSAKWHTPHMKPDKVTITVQGIKKEINKPYIPIEEDDDIFVEF